MAVFTPVSLDDLSGWISRFSLGKALAIQGISSGIENSNFFITTESGEYVLTLFEKLGFAQLPFYLELMRHLAQRDVLVPAPVASRDGSIINALNGKPAAIVTKLEGTCQLQPQPVHCAKVGTMLAKMHLAAQDFSIRQANLRGLSWWRQAAPAVQPYLNAETQTLLRAEMQFQETFAASALHAALPNGPVHADLFRDNAMFVGTRLTGFFDFYFAGCDTWLFDLAVAINDWCIALPTGALDLPRAHAMLEAYHAVRRFTDAERQAWHASLRAAALRFWLSRLYDFHLPRAAQMLTPHDPTHFERILRLRVDAATPTQTSVALPH